MKYVSLAQELSSTSYPGRGIVIGRSADGKKAVTAYFIMGRSENSRNRIFVTRHSYGSLRSVQTQRSEPDYLRAGTRAWQ